jgi:hypothetical protein
VSLLVFRLLAAPAASRLPAVSPPALRTQWIREGFVIIPGLVSKDDLANGVADLPTLFPTAADFHADVDPERNARFRDEFGGITNFPFAATSVSLLSVHRVLIDLAQELLDTDQLRVYSIEAWAKYTGAADYDQYHHRDYLNQTLLVPAPRQQPQQVEMFLYLVDVPAELGPPSYVAAEQTPELAALPNWYPPIDGITDSDAPPGWVSGTGCPQLYEAEASAAGPAGTVAAYRNETFHRATALTLPRGVRYTLHVNFRIATSDWIGMHSWSSVSLSTAWTDFVVRASPRQLELFGFPPPGHPYWTDETLAGMALRYPGFNQSRWSQAQD